MIIQPFTQFDIIRVRKFLLIATQISPAATEAHFTSDFKAGQVYVLFITIGKYLRASYP